MTDQTPIYEYVMDRLKSRAIPQRQVASQSGVPFSTLCKIAQGSIKDPRVHTVQRLANYFRSHEDHAEPPVQG